jgi:type IV pilus assembly protein PilB
MLMSPRLSALIVPGANAQAIHEAAGEDEEFFSGRGCSHCEGLGIHKRMAVYELMLMSPRLSALIVPGANAQAIHEAAVEEGMTPITQAAVALARDGTISLAEAWRVRAD